MRKLSKNIMTVAFIFGSAYMLAATSGCADSSGSGQSPAAPVSENQDRPQDQPSLQPVNPSDVNECSSTEFAQLVSWRNAVNKANSSIDQAAGKKQTGAIEASLAAIKACDSRMTYHKQQPCKKTTQNVVQPKPQVKVYDAYTIHRDCAKVDGYLKKHNLRPDPSQDLSPAPSTSLPVEPTPPPQLEPVLPPTIVDGSALAMCSADEFARLSEWSASLDRANKSLAKLGSSANWKYDEMAVSNAGQATKSCETLMKYHEKSPCQKNIKQDNGSTINRQYTREAISERCQTTRKYFYEYVQNKQTLMWPNAELYADLSRFMQQRFEAQSFVTLGNCVAENRTDQVIDYSGRKARVVETRGFEQKMLVLITEEGLKIDCYGLDLDGPFSKTQVVKLLQAEGTDIRLEYKLK